MQTRLPPWVTCKPVVSKQANILKSVLDPRVVIFDCPRSKQSWKVGGRTEWPHKVLRISATGSLYPNTTSKNQSSPFAATLLWTAPHSCSKFTLLVSSSQASETTWFKDSKGLGAIGMSALRNSTQAFTIDLQIIRCLPSSNRSNATQCTLQTGYWRGNKKPWVHSGHRHPVCNY